MPPGNLKPQDKHLQTRAEYLIRLLKQDGIRSKAEELRQVSFNLKQHKPNTTTQTKDNVKRSLAVIVYVSFV